MDRVVLRNVARPLRPGRILPAALALLATAARADIPGVGAWAYQLQELDPVQVAANSTFDLIVMDPSADGSAAGEWDPALIQQIAASGKRPVAYLSIGEAESYRWYWQPSWDVDPPAWLGPENPDWEGNYKVRFWDPAWRAIVMESLERIVQQGFDGVYLDVVDAYWFWSEEQGERPQADADMAVLVRGVADSLRAWGGAERLVLPQNGEFLPFEDDVEGSLDDDWWAAIDGIGVEDVFHPGAADEDNPWNPDGERLAMLAEYRARQKTVLAVEYLTQPAAISQFRQAALDQDFIPYATVRALNVLRDGLGEAGVPPPHSPAPVALQVAEDDRALRLTLSSRPTGPLTVRLYDLAGRLVAGRAWNSQGGDLRLELPELAAGRYVCQVSGPGGWRASAPLSWIP